MSRYALAVSLLWSCVLRADDASDARKVVDRAIEAVGGESKLTGLTGGVWKTNGTVNGNPSRADFHGELPGKFRIDSTRTVNGEKVKYSRIVNGDKGWIVEGDNVKPMTGAEIAGVRSSFYHKQAATTLVPLTDKGVRLSIVDRFTLDGAPVVRIKAERDQFPEILFTFDTKTGLLVKSEMKDKDARTLGDRKVEIEWREYKEFDGVKMATKTKTYHNGKLFIDTEIIDFKGAKNLPEELFSPTKR